MNRFAHPKWSFVLAMFVPVALASLIAALANLASYLELQEDRRTAQEQQARDDRDVGATRAFNRDVAEVQRIVTDMLEKAGTGALDQASVNRVRTDVVNRLAALEQPLLQLQDAVGPENLQQLQQYFSAYRNSIVQATDLAVIDSTAAMQHAYRASLSYLQFSQKSRAIAIETGNRAARRNAERDDFLRVHAIRNAAVGVFMVLAMLVIWAILIQRLSFRLVALTSALKALARGEVTPAELPIVHSITRQRVTLLGDLARAVLAFRDTTLAQRQAQYDLGERMKELSCVYDVKMLTEDRRQDILTMLQAVAKRLPAGMRYPDIAVGWIEYEGQRIGPDAQGPSLRVRFGGTDAQPDCLGLTYTAALPEDAGAAFLPEEEALFGALAKRISDVLELRRKDAALAQSDRALRTARMCSQMLIRAQSEDQLMRDICRLAVDVGGYKTAWVGLADDDDARTVRPLAAHGIDLDSLSKSRFIWGDGERGQGTTGTAIRERRTIVSRDMMTNPKLAPWREAIVRRGYGSAIALPLYGENDQCIGAVSLYAAETNAFPLAEVELLEEMSHDLSFGIRTLRTRAAFNASHAELRKLSLVVEQSPNSIIITDLQARIEYVNPAFTQNTGFAAQDVLGQNPRLLQSGETPKATYEQMWATLLAGKTWTGEFTNRSRNGRTIVEYAIIIPLMQSGGTITHYVAIKEDITLKRQQEARLNMLALAVEQSPESIVVTNLQAQIEYVNETFVRNTGYNRDEVLGQNPRVLQSKLTPQSTYESMWTKLTAGDVWHGELFNRRKDGSDYVEFASIAPIRQSDGRITHYLAIKEDITDKKRMSDELERHRQHLEELVNERTQALEAALQEQSALFHTATAGIVLVRDRIIVRCNPTLDRMLGYEPGEQIGRATRMWYPDESAWLESGKAIYTQINAGGRDYAERELVRKDGSRFWARMSGRAIDPHDLSKGMVGVVEDISEERAAMAAINEARALAEAANRSKSEFLANMSHEIRTPMNAIIGMSHLALKTELDARQRSYIEKVHRSGENLLGIINDILDFSKIEAGKMSMESIDFQLEDVLSNMANLVGMRSEE